jgi:hypothetical protein
MTIKYERVVREIAIKPVGRPIFDELATSIRIEDEAAGPFLVVSQVRDDSRSGITIDVGSWDALKAGIDEMIQECIALELTTP